MSKIIQELLIQMCQRNLSIHWQQYHQGLSCAPHSQLRYHGSWKVEAALFWSEDAPSVQPDAKHLYMPLWTCTYIASSTHFLPLRSASHTPGQAAMGGGNARNAPNPGLVFWLVPDFMPSPPGSVARPPCARPTGSNTRPGQPSCS